MLGLGEFARACRTRRRSLRLATRLSPLSDRAVLLPMMGVALRDLPISRSALHNDFGILLPDHDADPGP